MQHRAHRAARRPAAALRAALGLAALLHLPACQPGAGGSADAGKSCNLAFMGALPLTPAASHLAFDATINDRPARLVLDTGAFSTVLTWTAAHRLGLRLDSMTMGPLEGIGGRQTAAIYRAGTIRVGNIVGRNFPVAVSGIDRVLGKDVDGAIGMDFFSRNDLDVDLVTGRLIIYQPQDDCSHASAYLRGPLYSVPLVGARPGRAYGADSFMSQPRIPVTIGGMQLTAALDTGAPQNLLFRNGAAKLGMIDLRLPNDPHLSAGGIGPAILPAALHTMKPIGIGDLELRNLRAAVIDQPMPDADLLLGLDFFRRVHVWISHSSGMLIMQFPPAPSPLTLPGGAAGAPGPAP